MEKLPRRPFIGTPFLLEATFPPMNALALDLTRAAQWAGTLALGLSLRTSANPALAEPPPTPPPASLRFQVSFGSELVATQTSGRLYVILGPTNQTAEPRHSLGRTGLDAPPFLAIDVTNFSASGTIELGRNQALFPLASLDLLRPGTYRMQAVLSTNRDIRLPNAPGNFYSIPVDRPLAPGTAEPIRLALNRREPEESLPPDSDQDRKSTRLNSSHRH